MSEFPAHWDIKNIGNFASRVRRKNTRGLCQDPMTISAIDGLVSQRDYFNKILISGQEVLLLLLAPEDQTKAHPKTTVQPHDLLSEPHLS